MIASLARLITFRDLQGRSPKVTSRPSGSLQVQVPEKHTIQYRQRDWDGALSEFERALSLRPGDGPSALYIERCTHYRDHHPPEDWAGIWEMTDK